MLTTTLTQRLSLLRFFLSKLLLRSIVKSSTISSRVLQLVHTTGRVPRVFSLIAQLAKRLVPQLQPLTSLVLSASGTRLLSRQLMTFRLRSTERLFAVEQHSWLHPQKLQTSLSLLLVSVPTLLLMQIVVQLVLSTLVQSRRSLTSTSILTSHVVWFLLVVRAVASLRVAMCTLRMCLSRLPRQSSVPRTSCHVRA